MKILVGCPILHRAWMMPAWFEATQRACEVADHGTEWSVIFAGDAERDAETLEAVKREAQARGVTWTWHHIDDIRPTGERDWNRKRYHRMVEVRNDLLYAVRIISPDAFLSLDSDILLAPDQLKLMLGPYGEGRAIGGKVYLSEMGTNVPSWGRLGRQGSLHREDASGTFPVEVIMAIKLMSPMAYGVDYRFHMQGEDTGWSLAAREAGVKLIWDGRVAAKHIFTREMLDQVDPRVGF